MLREKLNKNYYELVVSIAIYFIVATGSLFFLDFGYEFLLITVLYLYSLVWMAIRSPNFLKGLILSFLVISPVAISLIVGAFSAENNQYAFNKLDGAVLSSIFASAFLYSQIKRIGQDAVIKSFICSAILVFLLTILYKIFFGFFDRSVRFFLNGPIVFGWLMGFASILSAYCYFVKKESFFYLLAMGFFFLGVLWTQSKGPLVAVFFCYFISAYKVFKLDLFVKMWVVLFILYLLIYFIAPQDYFIRYEAIFRLISGDVVDSDYGSLMLRNEMLSVAWSAFRDNIYFGVGLTNLSDYLGGELRYPHNIFVEVLAELGLFGSFLFLATIIVLIYRASRLGLLILIYFLICSSFSGDISYFRLAFVFSFCFSVSSMDKAARGALR